MFRGILDNVLSGMKAGFKAILNLEHPIERKNRTYARSILTDGVLNCSIMYCESMPCLI